MSAIKHTPGPWTAKEFIARMIMRPVPTWEIASETNEFWIALVNQKASRGSDPKRNKSLITAAPELLEALKGLVWAAAVIPVDWKNPEAERLALAAVEASDKASAAIAKAEGRE